MLLSIICRLIIPEKSIISLLLMINCRQGDQSGKLMKPCDDEDCIEGSGSNGEDITEPEHHTTR